MKLNEVKELVLKNNLQEAIQGKSKSISLEQNTYQKEWFLLKQEYQKRYNELSDWLKIEKNKICVKHNLNLKKINLQ